MNASRLLAAVIVGACAAAAAVRESHADMAEDLARALDEWSRANRVALSREIRSDLLANARGAVEQVHGRHSSIPVARLEQLAPRAVVSSLAQTQKEQVAVDLSAQLECDALASLTCDVGAFGRFIDYPVLTVAIRPETPEDFVVTIDDEAYRAGIKVFRVQEGNRVVVVTRPNKPKCAKTLLVTASGPNTVECSM